MAIKEVVLELVERLLKIENELKLLQEDRKILFAEYKDKLDVKVFKAALRIAKIKSGLGEVSGAELENILGTVEDKLTIDFVE
tara:strand:- start:278 stop:526 length:249 start_codon:yes stop_codon:yes gene_type:complete